MVVVSRFVPSQLTQDVGANLEVPLMGDCDGKKTDHGRTNDPRR